MATFMEKIGLAKKVDPVEAVRARAPVVLRLRRAGWLCGHRRVACAEAVPFCGQTKGWKKGIGKEIRQIEREIGHIEKAEKKAIKETQALAKKGQVTARPSVPG